MYFEVSVRMQMCLALGQLNLRQTQVDMSWRARLSISDLVSSDIRHIAGRGPAQWDVAPRVQASCLISVTCLQTLNGCSWLSGMCQTEC